MKILAIIPARAGSKGIPNKNIHPLNGKPMLEYTIDAVENSNIDAYVISTDSKFIIDTYGGIKRPKYLSSDKSQIIRTIQHALHKLHDDYDVIMLLQPTSPLRTTKDINQAIELFKRKKATSLYSGYKLKLKTKDKTYNKYTSKPHFQRNGAIFMATVNMIMRNKIWDENVIEFEMPEARSVDIDNYSDLFMAECLLKGGVNNVCDITDNVGNYIN